MSETVEIHDRGLARAIGYHLGDSRRGQRAYTTDELASLTELQWSGWGIGEHDPALFLRIESLDQIGHCSGLRALALQDNHVTDTSPVSSLPRLRELWLLDNDLRSLDGLAELAELSVLNLASNPRLTDIRGLPALPALRDVSLDGCPVADYTPLLTLPKLDRLRVSVSLDDAAALEVLVALRDRNVRIAASPAVLRLVEDRLAERHSVASDDPRVERLRGLGLHHLASLWAEAGPHARDAARQTPLHLLLEVPREQLGDDPDATLTELVGAMLDAGVDPHARRVALYQETALTLALRMHAPPPPGVVERLVAAQRDWAIPYRHGTPLALAYEQAHRRRASEAAVASAQHAIAAMSRHDDALPPALAQLCRHAELDTVRRALDGGANPDGILCGETPLVCAVDAGRPEIVELLIERGADVNAHDHTVARRTPAHAARTPAMLDSLASHGADLSACDGLGRDPLRLLVDTARRDDASDLIAVADRLVAAGCSIPAALPTLIKALAGARDDASPLGALLDHWAAQGVTIDLNVLVDGKTLFETCSATDHRKSLAARFRDPYGLKGAKTATHLKQLDKKRTGKKARLELGQPAWRASIKLLQTSGLAGSPVTDTWRAALDAVVDPAVEVHGDAVCGLLTDLPPCDPVRIVKMLWLEAPDAADDQGMTPLCHVLSAGQPPYDQRAAWQALATERCALAAAMLDAGASPDVLTHRHHHHATTPLRAGLSYGGALLQTLDAALVARLATPITVDHPVGNAPLALLFGSDTETDDARRAQARLACARALIDAGADPTLAPVFVALCRSAPVALLREAIDAGAPVDTPGSESIVPLSAAVQAGHHAAVRLLLERGADPHHRVETHDGWPMALVTDAECARLLVEHGASVRHHSTRLDGKTAAHFTAAWMKNGYVDRERGVEILEIYLDAGADFTAQDAQERSVLDILREIATQNPGDEALGALIDRVS